MPPKKEQTPTKKTASEPTNPPTEREARQIAREERRSAPGVGDVMDKEVRMAERAVEGERPQEPQSETVIATEGSGETESMMRKDDNSPKPMDQDVAGPSTLLPPVAPRLSTVPSLAKPLQESKLRMDSSIQRIRETQFREQEEVQSRLMRDQAMDFATLAGPPPKPFHPDMSLNPVPSVPPVAAGQDQQGPTHQESPDLPLGEVLRLSQQLGIQNPKMSEVQELSKIALRAVQVVEETPQEPQSETVIAIEGSGESESIMRRDDNSPKPMDQDVAGAF